VHGTRRTAGIRWATVLLIVGVAGPVVVVLTYAIYAAPAGAAITRYEAESLPDAAACWSTTSSGFYSGGAYRSCTSANASVSWTSPGTGSVAAHGLIQATTSTISLRWRLNGGDWTTVTPIPTGTMQHQGLLFTVGDLEAGSVVDVERVSGTPRLDFLDFSLDESSTTTTEPTTTTESTTSTTTTTEAPTTTTAPPSTSEPAIPPAGSEAAPEGWHAGVVAALCCLMFSAGVITMRVAL
jgi:hypothetical protein